MVQHCGTLNRSVQVVNLDPAAELFNYPVLAGEFGPGPDPRAAPPPSSPTPTTSLVLTSSDIRELIQVDDVMEDPSLRFGPNGGLVFCMEYFANNFDWLEETLGHVDDDYILFDCPGE